jgi:type I restriction-modification system DNA methylase subunit
MTDIVGKLWGFCHTLRHDGIDYGDYIEQLTYFLFLKMIEEKRSGNTFRICLVCFKGEIGR